MKQGTRYKVVCETNWTWENFHVLKEPVLISMYRARLKHLGWEVWVRPTLLSVGFLRCTRPNSSFSPLDYVQKSRRFPRALFLMGPNPQPFFETGSWFSPLFKLKKDDRERLADSFQLWTCFFSCDSFRICIQWCQFTCTCRCLRTAKRNTTHAFFVTQKLLLFRLNRKKFG